MNLITNSSRTKVFQEIKEKFPLDWLLPVEIYELAMDSGDKDLMRNIKDHLYAIKLENPNLGRLIDDGLALAANGTKVKA